MKKQLTLCAFILLSTISFGQQLNIQKLDSLFTILEKNNKFMGTVSISENGKTLYSKAVGYADVENKIKSNTLTKYRIGSISKTFTATLILKAIDEGKLKLSTPLETYFSEVNNSENITIENLLNHRSGIYNFTNDPKFGFYNHLPKSRKELLKIITEKDAVFEANTKTSYSNSNYVLLTFILEDIYNTSYDKLLKENITDPIGLKNTHVGGKINPTSNECNSYSFGKKWHLSKETHMSIPQGAGFIISTPEDLNTFFSALFHHKIISPRSLSKMTTITDGLGLGIFKSPYNSKEGYGHNGRIDNFTSLAQYFLEDKLAISITSNGGNYPLNLVLDALFNSYYNKEFVIPSFKTIQLSSGDLDKYLGVYKSTQLPLNITISKNGTELIGQATGQSSFPLTATDTHIFEYSNSGIHLEFTPDKNQMILKQGGATYVYTKGE